jgi:two-component system LytT family response regulator
MKNIRTILVDDEFRSRELIGNYLKKHCPDVEIIAEASSAEEAFQCIRELSPDMLFLDIRMPGKNGFDLLRMFDKINFDVIFISGFDEYAIRAFDFNAIDYILKPVDYQKLIQSVEKAKERILMKRSSSSHLLHFVKSIDEKNELIRKVTLHLNDKVCFVDVDDIICVEALRGYCRISTSKKQSFISAKPLKEYEKIFSDFPFFYKANKGMIVNLRHIENYSKGISCFISMSDETVVEVSKRKKTEILQLIRDAGK